MKPLKIAVVILALGIQAANASTHELTREQVLEVHRTNPVFCYNMDYTGACAWIDFAEQYSSEEVVMVGTGNLGSIIAEEASRYFWDEGRLCEVEPFTYIYVNYYDNHNDRYDFWRRNARPMPADLVKMFQAEERNSFAGYECFALEPAAESANHDLVQVKYINGVRQPDVDLVTLIPRSEGSATLQEQ